MNFKLNNTLSNEINTLIIGIPEHLNQLERISFNHIDITESLERLKHQHIIGSKVGKIYTTAFDVQDQTYRLPFFCFCYYYCTIYRLIKADNSTHF